MITGNESSFLFTLFWSYTEKMWSQKGSSCGAILMNVISSIRHSFQADKFFCFVFLRIENVGTISTDYLS